MPTKHPPSPAVGQVEPLALPPIDAAALLCVSRAYWWKMMSRGLVPYPVYVGSSKVPRWRVSELRAWLDAGCPCRREWIKRAGASREPQVPEADALEDD
jgi:predicted DNA-binding transcriptional regulator AlpA